MWKRFAVAQIATLLALLVVAPGANLAAQGLTVPGDPPLAYWIYGAPTQEPMIIVLHGGPGVAHGYLLPEWRRLAKNRQVVFYDQRGCGRSGEADTYTWRDHLSDVRRVIHEVSPRAPVVLVGSSWGAMLATYYAEAHPEDLSALVLSGMNAPNVWTRPGSDEVVGPLPDLDPSRARRDWRESQTRLSSRMQVCPSVQKQTVSSFDDVPESSRLYEVAVPVLFFPDNRFGREFEEAAASPEEAGQFWTVVGGGHDPWYTHTEAFFAAVKHFLGWVQGT